MSAIIHSSQSLNPSASLRLTSANAQQPISFPFSSQLQREQQKQKNGVGIPQGQVIRADYLVKKVLAKEMEELVKGRGMCRLLLISMPHGVTLAFSLPRSSKRGVKVKSLWYFLHWLLGTGITIAGVIDIYIDLHAYHVKTSKSVKLWTVLFTAEVAVIAFIYLFQNRWDYMKKQGVILGEEQITPTDHATPPRINSHQKELGVASDG